MCRRTLLWTTTSQWMLTSSKSSSLTLRTPHLLSAPLFGLLWTSLSLLMPTMSARSSANKGMQPYFDAIAWPSVMWSLGENASGSWELESLVSSLVSEGGGAWRKRYGEGCFPYQIVSCKILAIEHHLASIITRLMNSSSTSVQQQALNTHKEKKNSGLHCSEGTPLLLGWFSFELGPSTRELEALVDCSSKLIYY